MDQRVYISITGLKVKRLWHVPTFWRHAIGSMQQVQSADGCLQAQEQTINGIHHTRSVWVSRDKMLAYLRSGAHLKAITVFPKIATGKVYGYVSETVPDWPEVHRLWAGLGREV
ncbi:MAG: hypothetical protein QNI84_15840 [Henriciella sp.]|nr:hypothetical protein [Henriciella sp.]